MSQRGFASAEFALRKRKRTRREKFLAEMERVVPRARLIPVIEALKNAICDSQVKHDFVSIDLSRESVPDARRLPKFRRLLLAVDLTKTMFG